MKIKTDLPEDSIDAFKKYLKQKEASPNTISSCLTSCRLYYSLYNDLSISNLMLFKDYLIKNYKPATANNRIYGMNRYLDSISHSSGGDPGAFRLSVIRTQNAPFLDNIISQEDYEYFKTQLRDSGNLFWYFVVRFLACTGARVSELIQFKAEHLRLGYIDLYAKGGKVRRIFFPETLCHEAIEWLNAQSITSGFIFVNHFGKQMTPRGISSQLKVMAGRYGIPPETVYPHSFRHRFAKNFLTRFNDISLLADLMGHESIETTKIYLTQSSGEQRELIDRIVVW